MGVGDLYDLQQEGGWEDLSVPQRFYVDVEAPRPGRSSVMDRWEVERRKRERGRPIQAVGPVQAIQAVGLAKSGRRRR